MNPDGVHVLTWVPKSVKVALGARAQSQGISNSRLVRHLIEEYLGQARSDAHAEASPAQAIPSSRLSVRLVLEDRRRLEAVARTKQLPASTYVSVLVRSHLTSVSPLVGSDLSELRRATAALDALGRTLKVLARQVQAGTAHAQASAADLRSVIEVCGRLRDAMRAAMSRNTAWWGGQHG